MRGGLVKFDRSDWPVVHQPQIQHAVDASVGEEINGDVGLVGTRASPSTLTKRLRRAPASLGRAPRSSFGRKLLLKSSLVLSVALCWQVGLRPLLSDSNGSTNTF